MLTILLGVTFVVLLLLAAVGAGTIVAALEDARVGAARARAAALDQMWRADSVVVPMTRRHTAHRSQRSLNL